MGPYCLGIFVGYLLYKQPQIKLPKHLTWLLWMLLPPLSFTTLLLTYLWNGAYSEPQLINPSPLISAVYVAIHRTIWTSLVAWLVFACATGRARLLASFLSHQAFVPLSRLSFSIYLVHMPLIMFRALNLRHTVEWTDLNIVSTNYCNHFAPDLELELESNPICQLWEACGNFIASVLLGYFLNVTFESPIINLERALWSRAGKPDCRLEPASAGGVKSAGSDLEPSRKTFQPQLGPAASKLTGQMHPTTTTDMSCDIATQGDQFEPPNRYIVSGAVETSPVSKPTTSEEEDDDLDLDLDIDMRDCSPSRRQPTVDADQTRASMMPARQQLWRNVSTRNQPAGLVGASGQWVRGLEPGAADRLLARYEQQWRRGPDFGSPAAERPAQYATLARTSQFNHQARHQQQHQQHPGLLRRRQPVEPFGSSGDYDSASRRQSSAMAAATRNGLGGGETARLQASSGLGQTQTSRRARYNTLSGAGAREWRHLEAGGGGGYDTVADRRRRASVDYWRGSSARATGVGGDLWTTTMTQPGSSAWMPAIPRINSNTLRRQHQHQQQLQSTVSASDTVAAESIAEEPEQAA